MGEIITKEGLKMLTFHTHKGQIINLFNQPNCQVNRDGFVNYGRDNKYPTFLTNLIANSPTHNACISVKNSLVISDGLSWDNSNKEMTDWIIKNQFQEIFKNLVWDFIMFNGFSLEVCWSAGRNFIDTIQHMDYANIRSEPYNANEIIDYYYFCKDWPQYKKIGYDKIRAFNLDWKTEPNQLFNYHTKNPFTSYYGSPSYIGGIDSIITEGEINNFHLSNIRSGFFPSVLINHKYCPSQDEIDKIEAQIRNSFGGSSNGGSIVQLFPQNSEMSPEITILTPNQNDKLFDLLDMRVISSVLLSNDGMSRILLGVATEGKLGGDQKELITAYKIFYSKYTKNIQNILLREVNKIMMINFNDVVRIVNSVYVNEEPSDLVLKQVLSNDEYLIYYRKKLNLNTDQEVLDLLKPQLLPASDFVTASQNNKPA